MTEEKTGCSNCGKQAECCSSDCYSPKFKRVIAAKCFGIYKDYDGISCDSRDVFVVVNKRLAEEACDILNNLEGFIYFFSEGHEWASQWAFQETIALESDIIWSSNALKKTIKELVDNET
jgi:hypothetical protein